MRDTGHDYFCFFSGHCRRQDRKRRGKLSSTIALFSFLKLLSSPVGSPSQLYTPLSGSLRVCSRHFSLVCSVYMLSLPVCLLCDAGYADPTFLLASPRSCAPNCAFTAPEQAVTKLQRGTGQVHGREICRPVQRTFDAVQFTLQFTCIVAPPRTPEPPPVSARFIDRAQTVPSAGHYLSWMRCMPWLGFDLLLALQSPKR